MVNDEQLLQALISTREHTGACFVALWLREESVGNRSINHKSVFNEVDKQSQKALLLGVPLMYRFK